MPALGKWFQQQVLVLADVQRIHSVATRQPLASSRLRERPSQTEVLLIRKVYLGNSWICVCYHHCEPQLPLAQVFLFAQSQRGSLHVLLLYVRVEIRKRLRDNIRTQVTRILPVGSQEGVAVVGLQTFCAFWLEEPQSLVMGTNHWEGSLIYLNNIKWSLLSFK